MQRSPTRPSLTALATAYSQIHLVDAERWQRRALKRLQADIMEQIARLNDLVSSINDVYDFSTKGLADFAARSLPQEASYAQNP